MTVYTYKVCRYALNLVDLARPSRQLGKTVRYDRLPQRQRIAGNAASVERGLVGKRPQNGLEHLSIARSSASPSAGAFAGGMNVCATAAVMSEIFGRNENCF